MPYQYFSGSEEDYLFAANIMTGNAFLPYLELSTYDKEEMFFQMADERVDQEKEVIKKDFQEKASRETREFLGMLFSEPERTLTMFLTPERSLPSKRRITIFLKKKGLNERKIERIFKELSEFTKLF